MKGMKVGVLQLMAIGLHLLCFHQHVAGWGRLRPSSMFRRHLAMVMKVNDPSTTRRNIDRHADRPKQARSRSRAVPLSQSSDFLLPTPSSTAIGNFFEMNTTERQRLIQCNLIAMASMDGTQYGVGFPLDMPVAIAFFNGSELTFVTEQSFPKYDALLEYIDEQLDDNDISLLRTPVVLTVAGEFDEDDVSVPYLPRETATSPVGLSAVTDSGSGDDGEEDVSFEDVVAYEDDVLAEEGDTLLHIDHTVDDHDDGDHNGDGSVNSDGDEDSDDGSILPTADVAVIPAKSPEAAGPLSPEAAVSDEDVKSLLRAHTRADRILEYAADVKLMGSFQFERQNFHLLQLLEVNDAPVQYDTFVEC
jgi:hypothetical protein